jgi:class 3 adenylate cyclase
VNPFTGDGVLALFGAPMTTRSGPASPFISETRCAPLPPTWAARHGVQFDIRMGLNSGERGIQCSQAATWQVDPVAADAGAVARLLRHPGGR